MKKRIFAVLIAMMLLLTSFSLMAHAAASTSDIVLTYDLSVKSGKNYVYNYTATPDEVITVTYRIVTGDDQAKTSTTQDQILYDHTFFELVAGSNKIDSDFKSAFKTSTPIDTDQTHYIFYNSTSSTTFYDNEEAIIGTFQLKVIAKSGSSTIRNTKAYATDKDAAKFATEVKDLTVTIGGETPPTPTHTHSWTYAATGNKITATCGNPDCTVTGGKVELTLTANGGTYNGQPFAATTDNATVGFSTTTGATVGNIQYYKSGVLQAGAPTDAGTYTAKITVEGKTAEKEFTISKATQTITAADQSFAFSATGAAVIASVDTTNALSYAVVSGTSVSVNSTTGALTINGIGDTTICVTAAGSDNYNQATKDIKVSIGNTTIDKPSADTGTFTYNKSQQTYMPTGFDSNTMEISNNVKTDADTYTVTVTPKSGYAWTDGGSCTFEFIINKANQIISASDKNFTYGDSGKSVGASVDTGNTLSYEIASGSAVSVNTSTGALTIDAAGTSTVKITAAGSNNYNQATKTVTVTVAKANYTATNIAGGELEAESGKTATITLPSLPQGASYGTPVKSVSGDKYTLSSIVGDKITVTSTGIAADTRSMTFTVPVIPDNNHNGYNITVTVTPKFHQHIGVLQNGKPAGKFEAGYKEYYTCNCGEHFTDEACTTPIEDLEQWESESGDGYIAPTHKHTGEFCEGKAPQDFEAGYKDYYKCSDEECGKYFEDATCTQVITNLEAWKAKGGRGYLAPTHQHQLVKRDGKPATEETAGYKDYYECENADCGKFFEDATGKVEITDLEKWMAEGGRGYLAKLEAKVDDDTDDKDDDSPKTGDNNDLGLWVTLMGISLAGFAVCGIALKKKKKED